MRWAAITVEVDSASSEAVTAALMDAGCYGVSETGRTAVNVVGHLPVYDDLEPAIDELRERLAGLAACGLPAPSSITLRFAEDSDWANEWRKHFRPMEIGDRIVIKPTWETYEGPADRVVVEIDPGMAFGTGTHPTTRLCLIALEQLVTPGCTVADVGCGSGILSIAAAKLGARTVVASEIDALPRRIAVENVAQNGLSDRITVQNAQEFSEGSQQFDLVVANILADTIIELAPALRARTASDGVFVACGIVEERLADVQEALAGSGFALERVLDDDLWRLTVARPCAISS